MIDSIGHDAKLNSLMVCPEFEKILNTLIVCINYYYIISFLGFDEFKDALVEFFKSRKKYYYLMQFS